MSYLPAVPGDLASAGISPGDLDVVLVTGDAYVDHSSFGAAIIGRVLQAEGYRVGILARPDPDDVGAFRLFGKPRLAWFVTAGAIDSMVSSYTANRKPRSEDDYAPGGNPSLCLRADGSIGPGIRGRKNARPDRALIVYATMCRQAFKGVPVVAGGLEASLRRLSHFDYWSGTVRRSMLLDSKADLIVYGMGETQTIEILGRLKAVAVSGAGEKPFLGGIRGTVWSARPGTEFPGSILLPEYALVNGEDPASKKRFADSFALQYGNTDPHTACRLIEPCGDRLVIQEAPAFPLDRDKMDYVYELPYERSAHPMYDEAGGVPALSEVKFSLLSARGCFGACSFCSITFHQGRNIGARSVESVVAEGKLLTKLPDFKGYIHDVGGPTANFRHPACGKMDSRGACTDRRCLAPEPCPSLKVDHREYTALLRRLGELPDLKKVFVRSGVRFDYAMLDDSEDFLKELVRHHVSGQLKVAPEHVSRKVLDLMGKPPRRAYDEFSERFGALNREFGLTQFLVPYFISAHPGSGLAEAIELAEYLRDTGFIPDQAQDFYPTPGTLSTAMWWCGFNPLDGTPVHVARGDHERAMQRALLQFRTPANAELVREALRLAGREDLIGRGPRCLVSEASARGAPALSRRSPRPPRPDRGRRASR